MHEALVTHMSDGEVDIPPDKQLRADLLGIRQKLTANGFTISLQEVGDRHCDYAPSVVLALETNWHEEPPRVYVPTLPTNSMVEDMIVKKLRARVRDAENDWSMGGPPDDAA